MGESSDTGAPKRLRILEPAEIEALYGTPRFTPDEQCHYFSLTDAEHAVRNGFRSVPSQICFILQLGYFKAKQRFFTLGATDVAADVTAILAQHFPQLPPASWELPTKPTIHTQRATILTLFRYRFCLADERQLLVVRARQAAQISSTPISVFRELLQYLTEQRIVAPGYTVMQDLVSQALTFEQQRLITILRATLTIPDTAALDQLLAETDGSYPITQLKHEPKDFSLGAMRQEVSRAALLRPLYALATRILPHLALSTAGIATYASLVMFYAVFRLQQLDRWLSYLYLLCFVAHRYHRLHDHLLTAFMHGVAQFRDAAKTAAQEQVATLRLERTNDLVQAGHILKLFTSEPPNATVSFQAVQAQAFALLDRDRLTQVAAYLATQATEDETALQWAQLARMALRFKRQLRPLLLAVEIAATRRDSPLMEAVAFLKQTFTADRPLRQSATASFPSRCIPVRLKRYVYTEDAAGEKRLIPDRYEFLIYQLVRNGLESGDIVCRHSVHFRSFEDDLLSDAQWQDKAALLAATGRPILQQPIQEHLVALEAQLEARLVAVNQRIANGDNAHIQVTQRGDHPRWTLPYPQASAPVNHPVFDGLPQVDINGVLAFADQDGQLRAAFTHVLGRYQKLPLDAAVLRACLVAWGTNMGLGRMGDISDLSAPALARASENYLRLETLNAANDQISNAIAALPITRHYDLGAVVHSSSDGQKFETAIPTINARYSPKYFGLHKGVVAYTLVANHIPVNARIIGAHEHESHYVFDLLFNTTTTIHADGSLHRHPRDE